MESLEFGGSFLELNTAVDTSREPQQKRIKSKKIPGASYCRPLLHFLALLSKISELSLMCVSLCRPTGVAVLSA